MPIDNTVEPLLYSLTRLLLLLFFIAPSALVAQPSESRLNDKVTNLAMQATYFEDRTGGLSLDESITLNASGRFLPIGKEQIHFGISKSAYWIHFTLPWEEDSIDHHAVLELGPPKIVGGRVRGGIDLFAVNSNGDTTLQYVVGSLSDPREIKTLSRGYAFRVQPETGTEYYLRVTSAAPVRMSLNFWQESAFATQTQTSNTGLGLMYGVLMAMILFNLFQFITIREYSYLLYVTAIGAQVFFLILHSRLLRFWLDGFHSTTWLIDVAERLVYPLMAFTFLAFQRSLLHIPRNSYVLDRVGRWFMYALGASALLAFIPDESFFQVAFISVLTLGLPVALYSNFDAMKRGNTSAAVHMAGMGAFLIGCFIMLLVQTIPAVPANVFTSNAFNIGQIVQALLLSLSLSTHYSLVKREKEDAQKLAIDNLVRAEKIKDELLENVSHELRTPLFGINGLAESALLEFKQNNQNVGLITKNLELIQASGNRLTMLVNDLLDFASSKDNQVYIKFRPVDLHQLATLVIAICSPLIGDKNIKLRNKIEADLPLVTGDEDRLQQILVNLTSNAIKFTHTGEVEISAELSTDYTVRLSVRDTGIGIHASDQETIFKSFEKLSSKHLNAQGVGLGLPIAKRMVELHRSELHMSSELDIGTEFYFHLRVSLDQNRTPHSNTVNKQMIRRADFLTEALSNEALPYNRSKQETSVLIVDDDEINRVVMGQQLSDYTIVSCSNGLDALTAVDESKPDLILLDLMMPGLNGYEVCQKLRQQYSPIELPIILVTAKNHLEDLTKGFQTGANDYLPKPFHNEELKSRVENQLKLSRLHRVNEDNIRLRALIKSYSAADAELRASRMQLQRVLETIEHGFIAFELPGRVFSLNQTAADLLCTDKSSLVGEDLTTIFTSHESNAPFIQALNSWEAGDSSDEEESPIRTLQGRIYTLRPYNGADKEDTKEAMYGARLTLFGNDEGTGVLFIHPADNDSSAEEKQEKAIQDTIELVNVLGQAQQNVRRVAARLAILTPEELSQHPDLILELDNIERLIGYMDNEFPEISSDSEYRQQLVTLMRSSLHAWEVTTQKSKIELAEESNIWAVSIDDGRLRTRTFDRYSRIEHLPKVPRWREVVRTAYFVLSLPSIEPETRAALEAELERTKDILKRAAIS